MVGQTVSHYRIVEKLGEGGMGVVYKAEDTKLRRMVALKFPPIGKLAEEDKERFVREAQAAAALNHPNICTVHQIGESDELTYIAMEFVEGESVKGKARARPLLLDEALNIAIQAAQGLQAAHQKGIVHRDIKGSNLMVTVQGRVKVLDFGLAQMGDRIQLTKTGTALGTPAYMSPEQALAQPLDRRTDIWSLGVVLYEMLTGQLPFQGEVEAAIAYAVVNVEPQPLTAVRSGIPIELDHVISKALTKNRDERYQHIEELVVDLRAVKDSLIAAEHQPRLMAIEMPKDSSRMKSAILKRAAIVVLVLTATLTVGWQWYQMECRNWAFAEALPAIEKLEGEGKRIAAFDLALQARPYTEGNPRFEHLWSRVSINLAIDTTPPGALVFYKDSTELDGEWQPLGESPIPNVELAAEYYHFRFEKAGFAPAERAVDLSEGGTAEMTGGSLSIRRFDEAPMLNVWLARDTEVPLDMVHVPGGNLFGWMRFAAGNIVVKDFLLDRYEVTNQEFLKFVEAGGYKNPSYWKNEFIKEGRVVSWDDALSEFHDATGRPGPATWELGRYRDGEADLPVGGVSWYEAAAYAEYVGKSLPTVYHWARTFDQFALYRVAPLSNFSGERGRPVHHSLAMGPFGAYDQAGNVKEWCVNPSAENPFQRYILGGGFGDATYLANELDSQDAFGREPNYGFRCVRFVGREPPEPLLFEPVRRFYRDYSLEKPASDEQFEIYRRFYSYDPAPLNAVVEHTNENPEFWRREAVSFDAAYGNERLPLHLLLPKNADPPYQTVVVFPGADALFRRTSADIDSNNTPTGFFTSFLVRTGRAVAHPVFASIYERFAEPPPAPGPTNTARDLTVKWYRDLARTMDYLETRPDIDRSRIAYFGLSMGGQQGPIMLALEPRFRVAVFCHSGLMLMPLLPEADPFHFAPRVTIPTLMINGTRDHYYPVSTSQEPLYKLLGTPHSQKKHAVHEGGHSIGQTVKETLAWLDKYLGPVGSRVPTGDSQ